MSYGVVTNGVFEDECQAWAHFDQIVERCDAFRMYKEVRGEYLQPRPYTGDRAARIDRMLIPTQKAIEAGWLHGAIGVECKKSGTKVGPVISQAMDYSRCVWELDSGFLIVLRWVFIWPMENPHRELESIMAQNRIGYVMAWRNELTFGCGGTNGIVIREDGSATIKKLPMGNKRGSR